MHTYMHTYIHTKSQLIYIPYIHTYIHDDDMKVLAPSTAVFIARNISFFFSTGREKLL